MAFTALTPSAPATGATPGFVPLGNAPTESSAAPAPAGGVLANISQGVAKGELATGKTLGTIGQTILDQGPGRVVNAALGKGFVPTTPAEEPAGNIYRNGTPDSQAANIALAPQGASQTAGYGAEKIGELMTPTGLEGDAAKLGAKLLPAAPKAAAFAARSVAAGLDQGGKTLLGGGTVGQAEDVGAAGALTPTIGAGLNLARTAGANSAPAIINSLIKPLAKSFAYGHDPARGILNEGITANSFDGFASALRDHLQAVGQSIGSLGQKVTSRGITSDFTSALQPLDAAMGNAAKLNNPTLFHSLVNVKDALTHSFAAGTDSTGAPAIVKGGARNLTNLDYNGGKALLDDITAHTRFTGNPSDDKALNAATQQAYGKARDILNSMADQAGVGTEARALNQRYGDLSAAQVAVNNREVALKRSNLVSLAGKIGLGGTAAYAVAHGILTGDWAGAGKVLVGDVALGLGGKAAGSTAVQTRAAQFLDALAPSDRRSILAANPFLKTVYQRLTGKFDAPPEAALPGPTPLGLPAPATPMPGAVTADGSGMVQPSTQGPAPQFNPRLALPAGNATNIPGPPIPLPARADTNLRTTFGKLLK